MTPGGHCALILPRSELRVWRPLSGHHEASGHSTNTHISLTIDTNSPAQTELFPNYFSIIARQLSSAIIAAMLSEQSNGDNCIDGFMSELEHWLRTFYSLLEDPLFYWLEALSLSLPGWMSHSIV